MDDCQEMRTDVEVRNVTVMFSGETGKEPVNKDRQWLSVKVQPIKEQTIAGDT